MRNRLNFKFLGCLLGITALVAVGVHFLHGYQLRRNAGVLLSQAIWAEEQDDFEPAAQAFRRYLGLVPGDTDALARYGLLLDRGATTDTDRHRVFAVLQQVVAREPQRHDIRRRLVEIATKLEWFTAARDHLDALAKASPDDAEVEHLLGRCEEGNAEYAKAAEWYAKAIGHDPGRVDNYVRLARLLRQRLGNPPTADALVDEMVDAKNPHSPPARLARARYLRDLAAPHMPVKDRAALLVRAAADVTLVLADLAPDDADGLLAAADLAEAQAGLAPDPNGAAGYFAAARQHLERGGGLHAGDARFPLALARLALKTGRTAEAVACVRRSLELTSGRSEDLWNAANLLIDAGEVADARGLIDRLHQAEAPPAPRDYLTARILLHEKRWFQASKVLEQVRPLLATLPELAAPTDRFLGQCYEHLGNPDQQLAAYQRAVAADPASVPARAGLASALFALGRIDEALNEYRAVVPWAPEARVVVARLLILQNLRLPPTERRWDEVDRVLLQAARTTPPSVHVPVLQAEILAARGQPAEARQLLEAARDKSPDALELWTALAGLAERQGEAKRGLSVLDEAERRLGARPELAAARARLWAKRPGAEARAALAGLERDLANYAGEEHGLLLRAVADTYAAAGDAAGAGRLWRRWAEMQPDLLHARLLLFDLALQARDEAELRRLLGEIRAIEGDGGPLGHYGEAARLILLARRGDKGPRLDRARAHLGEAAVQRPVWPRVALLQAELDELDGNQDRALESLQRAIELGHRQPATIGRVAQLLYDRRRYTEAEQVVRKLVEHEQAALPGGFGRLTAEIALCNEQHERALERAGRAVAATSKDYRDHIWLGQTLWALGRQAEAEAALRRALALADSVPDTWVALVQHLARTGQKGQAEAAVEAARRKLPADRVASALAQCYEALDRKDRAEEQYRAALAAKPDAAELLRGLADFHLRGGYPDKAEPHLRRLVGAGPRAAAGDAAWARRNLALVWALRGDYRLAQDALALVEQNLAGGRGPVEDQRARAVVLAMQPGRRREAIRLFEDLLRRQVPTPDEQFLLARLYEADRDWPNARDRLLGLLTSPQGGNPLYLAHHVAGLLRRGETGDAELWLARLEKKEPQAPRTLELKAQLLHARGRTDEAVALLRANVPSAAGHAGRVAALLEELGRADAAEEFYRRHAAEPGQSGGALTLAEFLGRRGRVGEALDLCDRAWPTCPPRSVAAASVAILRAGPADGGQCRRVERRLREAVAADADGASLFIPLGELLDLQGRYADAADVYRRAVDRDGRNVLALNNLAWLLALHSDRPAEGLGLIDRAIAAAGPVPDLLDTRAVVRVRLGQANPAVEDLRLALSEAPTAAKYFHLAQAQQLARNARAAADALRRADALGLKAADLHPLERVAYDRLVHDLARK